MSDSNERPVLIPTDGAVLEGILSIPKAARAVVLFAHGSGSSRHSPRNRHVAQELNRVGFATLLTDLLTTDEETLDLRTRRLRFDIELLTRRVVGPTDWLMQNPEFRNVRIGYFGSSTGAAAALAAAAERPQFVGAVVSRGGRPDLAGSALPRVRAPTLLIVGGKDLEVITMNEKAAACFQVECSLELVANATHLFEEPGALDEVVRLTRGWFTRHLASARD
jgi:dienelactone hydrolase